MLTFCGKCKAMGNFEKSMSCWHFHEGKDSNAYLIYKLDFKSGSICSKESSTDVQKSYLSHDKFIGNMFRSKKHVYNFLCAKLFCIFYCP